MSFSSDESRRYARHLVLRGVGGAGQQRLKQAHVAVLGAGGLGSPVIAYLAAAGIGRLTVIDDDAVSLSNLQRQVIHTDEGSGSGKASSAARFVHALNPHVEVVARPERLDPDNAEALLWGAGVIVEGSDSFGTRAAVARAAERLGIPLVSGAVSMWDGQVTVFMPNGPRFGDLYPTVPDEADIPSCEMTGVIGALTGVIGTLMAMEAIKIVTGAGEPLAGRLLLYDGRAARFTELSYGPIKQTAKPLAR